MNTTESEKELLERVQQSDVAAFRILFDRYQPVVFRHALFLLRDVELARDVVQETFLRIWVKRRTLQPHSGFSSFALTIGGNVARDLLRQLSTRQRLSEKIPPPQQSAGDNPEHAACVSALEDEISTIINDRLPERCRTIFFLSRIEGKSHREIAADLGITEKTVENQITIALKVLRKALRHYL